MAERRVQVQCCKQAIQEAGSAWNGSALYTHIIQFNMSM